MSLVFSGFAFRPFNLISSAQGSNSLLVVIPRSLLTNMQYNGTSKDLEGSMKAISFSQKPEVTISTEGSAMFS